MVKKSQESGTSRHSLLPKAALAAFAGWCIFQAIPHDKPAVPRTPDEEVTNCVTSGKQIFTFKPGEGINHAVFAISGPVDTEEPCHTEAVKIVEDAVGHGKTGKLKPQQGATIALPQYLNPEV